MRFVETKLVWELLDPKIGSIAFVRLPIKVNKNLKV